MKKSSEGISIGAALVSVLSLLYAQGSPAALRHKRNAVRQLFLPLLIISICLSSVLMNMNTISVVAVADEVTDGISRMQEEETKTQNAISSLQKESKETKAAIDSLKQQQEETKGNVSTLQSKSASLSNTFGDYSDQLDTLETQINDTEQKLRATSKEIVSLNEAIQKNKDEESNLYRILKLQIKNSYESGSNNSLMMNLLASKSVNDFLNRAEYVSALVNYQKRLLKQYKETGEELDRQAAELKAKEDELDAYQNALDDKQNEISKLADEVKAELNATNSDISNEKTKLADYSAQLTTLDQKQKNLESQVAAAQAKLAQQIAERLAAQEAAGKKENTAGVYSANADDLTWLAATIMAEAGGESYTGKLGVGTVIMNRVFSSSFPNTIKGVITQNMQFASYRSGKVEYYIEKGPSSSCIQAAEEVLNGARIGDYLFFMTKKWADYYRIANYTMVGNHAFFYKWVTTDKVDKETTTTNSTDTNVKTEVGNKEEDTKEANAGNENTDNGNGNTVNEDTENGKDENVNTDSSSTEEQESIEEQTPKEETAQE